MVHKLDQSRCESVFSGVALGITRAMLNDLLELTGHKHPRGARSSMPESPVVQTRMAELEAQLTSARAYLPIIADSPSHSSFPRFAG
jgi:hypothetical protein